MKNLIFTLVLAASTCTMLGAPVRAWDAGGHMISAQIALNQLKPATKTKVENLTKKLIDLRDKKDARPYDFVTSAAWMDDVKPSKKRDALSTWHYIDVECGQNPEAVEAQNGLDALKMAKVMLRSPEIDDKTKAEWLAIAIHVIGDLHQPLHASGRDRGGNDYLIGAVPGLDLRNRADGKPVDAQTPLIGDNTPKYARLHPLWDFGYRYDVKDDKIVLPYDIGYSEKPDLEKVKLESLLLRLQVLSGIRFTRQEIANIHRDLNPTKWARESSQISCDFAFSTPQRQTPSIDYIRKMREICRIQLALSGFHMANWLEDVFADEKK